MNLEQKLSEKRKSNFKKDVLGSEPRIGDRRIHTDGKEEVYLGTSWKPVFRGDSASKPRVMRNG